MFEQREMDNIKTSVEEFLQHMTMTDFAVEVGPLEAEEQRPGEDGVQVNIQLQEPQFLIGQNGQMLFELRRILTMLVHKKLQKHVYVSLDINDYKKKKIVYLKNLATSLADEVATTREKKLLPPMSSYERMVVHRELSGRKDVITESQGEGEERRVIIAPVS